MGIGFCGRWGGVGRFDLGGEDGPVGCASGSLGNVIVLAGGRVLTPAALKDLLVAVRRELPHLRSGLVGCGAKLPALPGSPSSVRCADTFSPTPPLGRRRETVPSLALRARRDA